jgi:hypothetical protein
LYSASFAINAASSFATALCPQVCSPPWAAVQETFCNQLTAPTRALQRIQCSVRVRALRASCADARARMRANRLNARMRASAVTESVTRKTATP